MREIKFRAWDKERKRMFNMNNISVPQIQRFIIIKQGNNIYYEIILDRVLKDYVKYKNSNYPKGFNCNYELDKELNKYYNPIRSIIIDQKHIMQFTGLKDKNNKDIYEGDIVEYEGNYCITSQAGKRIARVVFTLEEDTPSFVLYSDKGIMDTCMTKHGLKVVGNIYENPNKIKQ